MKSKIMLLVAALSLAAAPFALCSCGDKPPTTADSAGTPAGWSGHQIKLPGAKNSQTNNPMAPTKK